MASLFSPTKVMLSALLLEPDSEKDSEDEAVELEDELDEEETSEGPSLVLSEPSTLEVSDEEADEEELEPVLGGGMEGFPVGCEEEE